MKNMANSFYFILFDFKIDILHETVNHTLERTANESFVHIKVSHLNYMSRRAVCADCEIIIPRAIRICQ